MIVYYFKDAPFGRMPFLEADGTKIAGSLNILRYLGIKFGKNVSLRISRVW